MTTLTRRQFMALSSSALLTGLVSSSSIMADTVKHFEPDNDEARRRRKFVNNTLITHEGKEVRFYDDLMKGKLVLINFMYVFCKNESFCPMMSHNLSKVQHLLGNRLGKDVFMYSISLDPEHDTPEILASYASHFNVKPGGWQFMTGTPENIAAVRQSLGFRWADPKRDQDKQQHIGMLKYGIEPLERWGTCPALTKPEAIVAYLDWMTPGRKRPLG